MNNQDHDKKISGWRCPYCDALNDWQDSVCQICGDGRQESTVQKNAPQKPDDKSDPPQKIKSASPREPASSTAESPAQKRQTPPKATRQIPPKATHQKAAQPSADQKIYKSDTKQTEIRTIRKSAKKYRKLKWILLALVAVLGLYYLNNGMKAQKLAEQIDFSLLENIPSQASQEEALIWLRDNGYETVQKTAPGSVLITHYYIDDEKNTWDITLPSATAWPPQLVYSISDEEYDLNLVYDRVAGVLEENQWTRICKEQSLLEILLETRWSLPDFSRLSVWQDRNQNIYYLWRDKTELKLTKDICSEYEITGESIEYTKYELEGNEIDFQDILEMPIEKLPYESQELTDFAIRYSGLVRIVEEDYTWEASELYYHISNMAEVLAYLKEGIENATGKTMRSSDFDSSLIMEHGYYMLTEDKRITIEIRENRCLFFSIEARE